MSYQPPVREHLFLLRDVLQIDKHANLPGFADAPMDVVEQLNKEADFLNDRAADEKKLADAAKPLYDSLDDRQRTRFTDGIVRLSSERRLD